MRTIPKQSISCKIDMRTIPKQSISCKVDMNYSKNKV